MGQYEQKRRNIQTMNKIFSHTEEEKQEGTELPMKFLDNYLELKILKDQNHTATYKMYRK
jgi:hypothetical protein